eukprot:9514973-Alexandrium_andersonii.AAC.1
MQIKCTVRFVRSRQRDSESGSAPAAQLWPTGPVRKGGPTLPMPTETPRHRDMGESDLAGRLGAPLR